ncbi:MAG TPA: hypothetical protein VIC58_02405 [Actinomycetota bacterium]|jgi:hypothetical protein
MAIKGKSKTRSTKPVTRGPKPAYVPVRTPLLARRGFWIGVACALGVLLVAGLVVGFVLQRNADEQDELEQRMRTAVTELQGQVEPILGAIGQPVPPAAFQAFPELATAVTDLQNEGEGNPVDVDEIISTADDASASAVEAAEALGDIDEAEIVRGQGFSEAFVLNVIDAKGNMLRGVQLYEQTATLLSQAAQAEGSQRADLLEITSNLLSSADEVFARGYSDYLNAQTKAGVFQPVDPAEGQLPIPTGS